MAHAMPELEPDAEQARMQRESGAVIEGLAKFLQLGEKRALNRDEIAEVLRLGARARWLRKSLKQEEEARRALRRLEAEVTRLLNRRHVLSDDK
jgi:hypothetical protein